MQNNCKTIKFTNRANLKKNNDNARTKVINLVIKKCHRFWKMWHKKTQNMSQKMACIMSQLGFRIGIVIIDTEAVTQ